MNSFYHGAYTKDGFRHIKLKSVNPDCFRYILKGRSNEVKSNLFDKLIEYLKSQKTQFSVARCYDGRITAVKCEEKNFIICDGTTPFDERAVTYGGIDGIISLEAFQNNEILRNNQAEIVSSIQFLSELERKCTRFLSAAAGVDRDRKRLEKENTDSRKISRYSAKLWSGYGCPPSGRVGVEKKVLLTVPTANGVKGADCDMYEYCDTAIVISGSAGYLSDMIVDRIRRYALSSGVDIISCQSFLDFDGTPDHVIIPALRFGVFKDNKEASVNPPHIKKVRATRFLLNDTAENTRVRLRFNQRAYDSLIKEVGEVIRKIDKCNRELDEIYLNATDEKALFDFVKSKLVI